MIRLAPLALGLTLLAACANPHDPGQRALGGAGIGAASGAALGAIAGGEQGATIGAFSGGTVGAILGAATTPPPPRPPGYYPPPAQADPSFYVVPRPAAPCPDGKC
jgi:hypothetical protein